MRDKLYVGQVFTGSDWEIDANVSQKRTLSCRDAFLVGMLRFPRRKVTIPNEADRFLVSTKEPFSLWVSFMLLLKVSLPIVQTSPSQRCPHLRVRCDEFRLWLKDEKRKVQTHCNALDVILTQPKHVKNRCTPGRDDDKASSHSQDTHKSKSSPSAGPSRVLGPTLPSTADLVLAREREEEERKAERSYKRKRDKAEDKILRLTSRRCLVVVTASKTSMAASYFVYSY
ncbi:hypothetical protein C8J56DRAFT_1075981 [Mycena floridula]|nr:hypothetical protein C8J56DRAFT_1075981 [Mycena floridula]